VIEVDVAASSCEVVGQQRTVVLVLSEGISPYTIFWDEETVASSEMTRNLSPGMHSAQVIDQTGCEKTFEFEVPEIESFALSVAKNTSPETCPEQSNTIVSLQMDSPIHGSYDIEVEGVLSSGDEYVFSELGYGGQEFELQNLPSGMYTVVVTNESGCSQLGYFDIEESDSSFLKADFAFTSESLAAENVMHYDFPVQFENLSEGSGIFTYHWDFGDGESSAEQSPSHKFKTPGVYQVTLSVSNASGCEKELTQELTIAGTRFLRMPDAFTPNGDGKNDFYFPVFAQLKSIRFWVINRWGEIIFYSDDLNNQGWNGILKGEEAPNGTYVYRVEYLDDSDGATKTTQTGSFLLLK
jgi:gliding motility-associated-like protein